MREYYSHPTNDRASNQRLDTSNNPKDDRSDPDKLPIPPLNGHRIHGGDEMNSDDIDQRPEQGEAEHGPGIVQVDCLRAAHRERPVQAWEFRWCV